MDPTVDYDLARLCRCCRKRGSGLQSIFDYVGKTGSTLHEMLLSCTQSQLSPDDGLPEHLCSRCIVSVSSAYQFRKRFEESDAILREYVAERARQCGDGTSDGENQLLGGMSVKVELVDIKAEQIMIVDNPLVEEEEDDEFGVGELGEPEQLEPGEVSKDMVGVKSEPRLDSDGGSDYVAEDHVGYSSDEQLYEEKPKVSVEKKKVRIRKKPDPSEYKECPTCGKKFDTKYHLDRHIRAHKNDTQCEHCEKRFSAMDYKDYRKHMLTEHPGLAILPHRKSKGKSETQDDEGSDDAPSANEQVEGDEEKPAGKKKRAGKRRGANEYRECPICGKGFPSKYHLERHVKTHSNDTQCEFCDQQFSGTAYKEYCEHMQLEHPGMPVQPHKKTKPIDNSLVEEFFKSIQQKEIICKLCDVKLSRIAELRNHLRTHSDPSTLANAKIPTKTFLFAEGYVPENYLDLVVQQINLWDVQRFYQIVEPDGEELGLSDSDSEPEELVQRVHTCFICQQSFPRLKLLLDHAATGHQPEQLQTCQYCQQGFPNNTTLERHQRQQCANGAKKFLCAICNTKFMWQSSLDKHAAVHHSNPSADPQHDSGKRFLCPMCNKGFTQMHHLKRHVRGHMPSEKKFECPECHRKFHRKDNMKFHMRTHQPKKEDEPPKQTHLCSLCGRGFTSNYNYVVHMRRHTGERPFKCDLCDKAFPRSLDLTYHKRTHTGDKPSVCTICGKAFSRHHRLVRHMRVHTGARPYACTYCDRTFTQSNDLTLHIRRHTGEKPYSCPICNERFIQGTALRAHQRSVGHITEETLLPVSNYGRSLLEG